LTKFMVMATPDVHEEDGVTPRFLTADYDLLMIGFYEGPGQGAPAPPEVDFLSGVGQITPEQQDLVTRLNQEVAGTGYDGGNVTHHGPENQFSGSPYVDYPLTVFAPDDIPNGFFSGSQGGKILSIDMGPPGFRDIHLKRFINRMREEGYDLYDNPEAPGWHWEWDDGVPGYRLEDSDQLVDYVEQLPERDCGKSGAPGSTPCHQAPKPDASPAQPASWLLGRAPGPLFDMRLHSTVTQGRQLIVMIDSDHAAEIQLIIHDALGHPRMVRDVALLAGQNDVMLDIAELPTGIYWVHTAGHAGLRFVRM
ncbi:MAG: hypothetical protein R3301_05570, partial [Saprospiraceae bacterium]|nr:hypothetical protein [Saprospiraceae bacterium]